MARDPDGRGDRPSVSVIIPVRDGAAVIGEQLDALAAQRTDRDWELVVADNGSTDGTAEVVRAHPLAQRRATRVIDASERTGPNAARNAATRAARGAIVLGCDADDRVGPDWLEAHARALDVDCPMVSAGPLLTDALNAPPVRLRARGLAAPSERNGVHWGWTCNFGFQRAVWERMGGFDEAFVIGSDDVDFFIRAQKAGAGFAWVDEATVQYRLPVTTRRLVRRAYGFGRMRVVVARRHADVLAVVGPGAAARRFIAAVGGFVTNVLRHREPGLALGEMAFSLGLARQSLSDRGT